MSERSTSGFPFRDESSGAAERGGGENGEAWEDDLTVFFDGEEEEERDDGASGSPAPSEKSSGARGGKRTRNLGWLNSLSDTEDLVTVTDEEAVGEEANGKPPAGQEQDARPPGASSEGANAAGDGQAGSDPLLGAVLEDPVVRKLLQQGDVTAEQVRDARTHKKPHQPLWHAVVALDDADSEAIYAAVREHQGEAAPSEAAPSENDEVSWISIASSMLAATFADRFDEGTPSDGRFALEAADGEEAQERSAVLIDEELFAGTAPSEPTADGHALGQTPVANISTQWTEDGEDAPGANGQEELVQEDLETNDRVVAFLMRGQIVTAQQVAQAKQRKTREGSERALWRILADGEEVNRAAVFAEAARVYAFPIADLDAHEPNPEFTRSIVSHFSEQEREQLLELGVAPWRVEMSRQRSSFKLFLITHDPARPAVHRLAQDLHLDRFELQYAPEADVQRLLGEAFPQTNEYWERVEDDDAGMDLGANYDDDDELIDEEALEAEISRSKLINLFEATLVEAVREGASDIHIFPNPQKEVEILFRVDGRLKEWHVERKVHPEALLAVIKDNSMNIDRFEKDAAQDGYIQRTVDGALIRFRVSIMPIASAAQDVRAESIVIRVLDDRKVITDLSKLGLLENALEKFRHAISQPHGMVIMTGPTGSGKSTTLVAALHEVVSPEVNVLTVEDPVEYVIKDVRQIKLSHKLKLGDALRSILRHDPDVVMVGEMRDRETAELAIKLANTGHLTFSTLHTNDAPSAVNRLYKMGIEPFLIAYAINLVVAQRLIRTLCPDCKRLSDDRDPVLLKRLGFTEEEIETLDFYEQGDEEECPTCNGFGFKGRRAISEALHFSREIRHMIVEAGESIDEESIRQQAQEEGMFTLQGSAREVVKKGQTSVDEMMRVVATES